MKLKKKFKKKTDSFHLLKKSFADYSPVIQNFMVMVYNPTLRHTGLIPACPVRIMPQKLPHINSLHIVTFAIESMNCLKRAA